ncbi:hypothetical protein AUJ66_04900 [Candidatus Desantisbacteria bacterium CG1_02_38_46]|uniref:Uncharacterized protein n=3 Tax=unclassified Candidatus Desantisiibacteriota TaxID=3106372 RepID=A0A2H9PCM2_9BACT|nr:MAG: hypothetical protein AUJ66_04900 [Candidatus Desantisbacteria bacterium CG1_02_38_46]PIU50792.1 MAG: hypothetical protein COS91_07850 [Candidatus Desantisbacteria bacterium CG07_land_8_20_14_0_80_39_15]PIZ17055.1 MAG: hypothetical protein COY51_01185 [Candidatus Desantisbacteria bacterium CG_4_10_14_0_8_um_filter_39_17]
MKKQKQKTKLQIIKKLHDDGFIDGMVLWNLLGSRFKFKKQEIEEIDKTFREYYHKPNTEEN